MFQSVLYTDLKQIMKRVLMPTLSNFLIFLYLALLNCALGISKESTSTVTPIANLNAQYAEHWFSVAKNETIAPIFADTINDELSNRREFVFTSDDERLVNGTLANPKNGISGPSKVALLLHPMGLNQSFWWEQAHPMKASSITSKLRSKGYTVISLDAREHGNRSKNGLSSREVATALIGSARSSTPRYYLESIIGSVRDYRQLLSWVEEHLQPESIMVAGYSMGAQMSILLASYEPSVDHALIMVPPYVANDSLPVAPRHRVGSIRSKSVLWLAAKQDQYSTRKQTQDTFDGLNSVDKDIVWFDSNHRLPLDYLESVNQFVDDVSR